MDTQFLSSPSTEPIDLLRASATINDLLASFSRAPTPDGLSSSGAAETCCCGRDSCENAQAWVDVRAKLEKRLHLSAEVGQALLQRHEAQVRLLEEQQRKMEDLERRHREALSQLSAARQANDQLVSRMSGLAKQNGNIEKRLSQSQMNLDLADASNRNLLQEVSESRTVVQKLQHSHVRFSGLQARIDSVTQERDDLRDELTEQVIRTRAAESHAAALAQRCEDLESSLEKLRDAREADKMSQDEVLQDFVHNARSRLEQLRASLGHLSTDPGYMSSEETIEILESLVADNDALKKDNTELRVLLNDARDGSRLLKEEVDELRAAGFGVRPAQLSTVEEDLSHTMVSQPSTHIQRISIAPSHNRKTSWGSLGSTLPYRPSEQFTPSLSSSAPISPRLPPRAISPVYAAFAQAQAQQRRSASGERPRNLMTPDLQPPSPDWFNTSFPRPPSRLSSYEGGEGDESVSVSTHEQEGEVEPAKAKRKPLMLLSRSRGVQTDVISLAESMGDDSTPVSGRSRTVTAEGAAAEQTVSGLIARANAILTRLSQADVPTLTQRLKRQRLAGDVGHLSRSTIKSVISDTANMRAQFQVALSSGTVEESVLTRADLRALLGFLKSVLTQLAQLREVVNDVTLDPAAATKLRDPAPSASLGVEDGRTLRRPASAMGGWIAPISKLFGQTSPDMDDQSGFAGGRSRGPAGLVHPTPRLAPKLGAEVAASVTTVNVEFAASGAIRRAVSTAPNTVSVQLPPSPNPSFSDMPPQLPPSAPLPANPASVHRRTRKASEDRRENLRGIFAGSRNAPPANEGWVVLPKTRPSASSRVASSMEPVPEREHETAKRMSVQVDAVIDSLAPHPHSAGGQPEFQTTLLERTLRRRGLSDSSMHSTFLSAPVNRLISPASLSLADTTTEPSPSVSTVGSYSDRPSMFQVFGKRVQSLTASMLGPQSPGSPPLQPDGSPEPASTYPYREQTPATPVPQIVVRKSSIPQPINIRGMQGRTTGESPKGYGSLREESFLRRPFASREGGDYM